MSMTRSHSTCSFHSMKDTNANVLWKRDISQFSIHHFCTTSSVPHYCHLIIVPLTQKHLFKGHNFSQICRSVQVMLLFYPLQIALAFTHTKKMEQGMERGVQNKRPKTSNDLTGTLRERCRLTNILVLRCSVSSLYRPMNKSCI